MKSFDSSFFKQMTSKKTEASAEPEAINQLIGIESQLLAMVKLPKALGGTTDVNPEIQDSAIEIESALSAYVEV